jgi:hypothetical protein
MGLPLRSLNVTAGIVKVCVIGCIGLRPLSPLLAAAFSTFNEPTEVAEDLIAVLGVSEFMVDDSFDELEDVVDEVREEDVWFEMGKFLANLSVISIPIMMSERGSDLPELWF